MKVFAVLCSIALAYAHRPTQNLVEICESTPNLSILTAALVAADLTDTLSDTTKEFTVFAPTDDAFNALPAGVLDHLMKPENKQELVDILTYHVLPEQVKSTDLQPFQAVTTVEGKPVHVTEWGGKVRVGPSLLNKDLKNVVAADNLATNGVAHIIDGVLLPPATLSNAHHPTKNLVELCESTPNLSILTAALVAADLTDTLSDKCKEFTVFAPTNDAFNALPAGVLDHLMKPENKQELVDILTYHVLPEQVKSTDLQPFQAVTTVEGKPVHVTEWGGKVRVGPSLLSKDLKNVVAADNLASNGVAHIIDGVLLPPATLSNAQHPSQNLVELCESTPNLSILTSALVAADLTDTLSDASKKFTVFAPTNDAFNALPAGVLDHLMKPENKQELADILTYHVLPEEVKSTDLQPFQAVTTVEGKPLQVAESGGNVRVGPSLLSKDVKNVVAADNLATNGVAHIIDGVLLPSAAPTMNLVQLCEATPNLSILTAALVAADLTDTLSDVSKSFTVFAPTDDAFNALPAGVLDHLMKPENKQELVDVLTYHVLPEQVLSTDLNPFQAVTTVEGKPLHVTEWGGKVSVGPSLLSTDLKNVIAADNVATNGVAHIVDGVLLPPQSLMV